MPVIAFHTVYVRSLDRRVTLAATESYVGRVLKLESKVERIMSDVWDDVWYAVVVDYDGSVKSVLLGCSEFESDKTAWSDATPDALELAERFRENQRIAEIARQNAERERIAARNAEIAARVAARPKNGDSVQIRVDRRCRNPELLRNNGKTGKVFWVRDDRYGVALSDARDARGFYSDVVWARASQLVKVVA